MNDENLSDQKSAPDRTFAAVQELGAACQFAPLIGFLAKRWTVEVICILGRGQPLRFGELRRASRGGVSPRVLASTLRSLERVGLTERMDLSENRLHVEYTLTQKGFELLDSLRLSGRFAGRMNILAAMANRLAGQSPAVDEKLHQASFDT